LRLRPKADQGRQLFLQLSANKIKRWFNQKGIKPIHIVIIERVFSFMWRERTTARTVARMRSDRGRNWWDSIKDLPTEWRKHTGSVHAHCGRQKCEDAIFFETWGSQWRDRFDSFTERRQWMAARSEFVREACTAMGLPVPLEGATTVRYATNNDEEPQAKRAKVWSMTAIALPALLARDKLWTRGINRPQLEFVVDNQTLANIANGTARVTNPYYRAPLDRIRAGIGHLYGAHFEYKSAFLDPVDWRPREFNTAADHVANCVLAEGANVDTLREEEFAMHLQQSTAIQVFSDGGFVSGTGAAAFVIVAVTDAGEEFQCELIGARGVLVKDARSAFHMEVLALELAIEFALNIMYTGGQ
jgi:hypothetical protein